jgi:hypothetical protein
MAWGKEGVCVRVCVCVCVCSRPGRDALSNPLLRTWPRVLLGVCVCVCVCVCVYVCDQDEKHTRQRVPEARARRAAMSSQVRRSRTALCAISPLARARLSCRQGRLVALDGSELAALSSDDCTITLHGVVVRSRHI